ncbi:MAG: UpxY family transcription antiterminator [Alistipes sp.]|nr:UpxY family transcription antiterminator [Alistipes sp.]
MCANQDDAEKHWHAMRDLKRTNAMLPAYKQLSEAGMEVFTPMSTRLVVRNGKRTKVESPVIHDLLFVNDCRRNIDPVVAKTPTLQYRFKKGGRQGEPIIVPDEDMRRFIGAIRATDKPKFYSAEEITDLMCGRDIRIVGGALNGYEGKLQTVQGSKYKRLVLTLPSLMAVSVEINDAYVELL